MTAIGLQTALPLLGLLTPPSWPEYGGLLPGAIAAGTALLIILLNVFHKGKQQSRDYLAYVTSIGLGLSLVSTYILWDDTFARPIFHGSLYVDKFTLFFTALFSVAGILSVLVSPRYLVRHGMNRAEYYLLIALSVSGMAFLAGAADLVTFFVAFEVMSIPVYCIAGYLRRDSRSAEAAMKYFVLGAFSAALMLYGIALLYGSPRAARIVVPAVWLGTGIAVWLFARDAVHLGASGLAYGMMTFVLLAGLLRRDARSVALAMVGKQIAELAVDGDPAGNGLLILGVLLLASGFVFKIASAPFHLWTPDVYTGSPTPAVGFMATAVKASAFAPLIRVFTIVFGHGVEGGELPFRGMLFGGFGWVDLLAVAAAASMILGNLVAITQSNVKRMLAYSTIAHAGYLLVGVTAAGAHPQYFLYHDAVLFYLVAYTFATIGAFGVLAYFERRNKPIETYDDLDGLGFQFPTMGLVMGLFMFSAAGIPPTAGFVAKLYVFRGAVDVGIQTGQIWTFIGLAVLAVLTSVAGVYYYLRVLVHMFMYDRDEELEPSQFAHPAARAALVVCGFATLYFGVLPARALELSRDAVMGFSGAPPAVQKTIDRAAADEAAESEDG
ncbi:MAG: NADH-quinone oxidoreductase subunit N [Bradymonadaceae bacterium]